MDHREGSPITLSSKSNMVKEVILVEEDLTKEVEVEDEASLDATNATSWAISHLNLCSTE